MADVSCHSCHWLDVGCRNRCRSDVMRKAQVTAAQWPGEQLWNEAPLVDQDTFFRHAAIAIGRMLDLIICNNMLHITDQYITLVGC